MTDETTLVPLPATQAHYCFVSVHRIAGFSVLAEAYELQLKLTRPNTVAYLTSDPNPALVEVDEATAVKQLTLRAAFGGKTPVGSYIEAIRNRALQLANIRIQKFGSQSVYLVLKVRGILETVPTTIARDLGGAVLAFDAIDSEAQVANHQPVVSSALTALSLLMDTSADIATVAEGISFELPDGRPLYAVTIRMGGARATISRPVTQADAVQIAQAINIILANERLATPSRLLADALRSSEDRLEAFIFAWAALEMLIRKFTFNCEDGKWVDEVPQNRRSQAEKIHRDFAAGGHRYSLVQRALAFALTQDMSVAEDLAREIGKIRKNVREPLFHEGKLVEHDLPVGQVIGLVRKLTAGVVQTTRVSQPDPC